jgi:ribosomal protein S18 acetylase RimI-like enzyme
VSFRFLSDTEWHLLRDVRLGALQDSPGSFLSGYDTESRYEQPHWECELRRGLWLVCHSRHAGPLAVLGATAEPDTSAGDRYLSYLWVHRSARRTGIATRLVTAMLDRLCADDVVRASLWVIDGNEGARALYTKLGFHSTGRRQPLLRDSGLFEELFTRTLDCD